MVPGIRILDICLFVTTSSFWLVPTCVWPSSTPFLRLSLLFALTRLTLSISPRSLARLLHPRPFLPSALPHSLHLRHPCPSLVLFHSQILAPCIPLPFQIPKVFTTKDFVLAWQKFMEEVRMASWYSGV